MRNETQLSSAASELTLPFSEPRQRLPCWLQVFVIWCVSALIWYYAAIAIKTPTIFTDELFYWDLARTFHQSGRLMVLGNDYNVPTYVYPMIISPAFAAQNLSTSYKIVRLMNTLLMLAALFPVYGLARELLDHFSALAATVLTAAIPSITYSTTVMCENAFFPIFVLGFWLGFRVLLRPSPRDAWLCGLAFSVGYYVKPHVLVLIACYALCAGARAVSVVIEPRRRVGTGLGEFVYWSLPLLIFAMVLVFRAWQAPASERVAGTILFGGYSSLLLNNAAWQPGSFLDALIGLLLAVGLGTAVFPLLSFAFSIFDIFKLDCARRWYWIFTALCLVVFLALVARHNALNDLRVRVHERYIFMTFPLLFIWCFAIRSELWRWPKKMVILITIMFLTAVFYLRAPILLSGNIPSDSPSLTGFWWLVSYRHWDSLRLALLFMAFATVATLAAFSARKLVHAVPLMIAILVLLSLGWFQFQKRFFIPMTMRFQQLTFQIEGLRGPTAPVAFIADGLDVRIIWFGAFWLPNNTTYRWRVADPWWGKPLAVDSRGDFDFGDHSPALIVASPTIRLPGPVVLEMKQPPVCVHENLPNSSTR